jgi:hypothetical protein
LGSIDTVLEPYRKTIRPLANGSPKTIFFPFWDKTKMFIKIRNYRSK